MTAATQIESNVQQAVPFFMVRDMEASVRFYVHGLGFSMTHKWVVEGELRWCWLKLGGAAVMLQELREGGHHSNVPEWRVGVGVSIYFICRDAVALWRDLISRGVAASRPFVGNGMWVTGIRDPDGYELYFESPTDAPEETVLSDDR